jgi:hypothetical protein
MTLRQVQYPEMVNTIEYGYPKKYVNIPIKPPKPTVMPRSTLYTSLCGGKYDGNMAVRASRTPAPMLMIVP